MKLAVYRDKEDGKELVGCIVFERGAYSRFEYDASYATKAREKGEIGISERLPLSDKPYEDNEIAPFFQGLLPEGEVLANLASAYQVARNDYLTLLEKLGCESIGALTFIVETADASDYAPDYQPVTEHAISEASEDPIRFATTVASETRLSLAGAQSKVAWYLPEGLNPNEAETDDWLVPKGTAPSTHIVKISRSGEEELALNELACSILSTSCGIETAEVSLLPDIPGAIAVRRYDREWIEEGHLLRLHQEDLCQALGLPPIYKYQPEGVDAAYIMHASDLLRDTVEQPVEDAIEFAKRLAFNYAVGNADAHLKNSSLLYDREWKKRRLAPMYDVTCIPLSGYSTQMPFDFGAHRAMDDIDERDIMSIALDADVSLAAFDHAIESIIKGFETPAVEGADEDTQRMLARIIENSAPRIEVLKRYLCR